MTEEERRQRVNDLLDTCVKQKEHQWHVHGERDMHPRMAFLTPTDAIEVPAELLATACTKAPNLSGAVYLVCAFVKDKKVTSDDWDELEGMLVIADSYISQGDADTAVMENLGESFHDDPESNVIEAVCCYVIQRDVLNSYTLDAGHIPYTIGDGGVLQWQDREIWMDGQEGSSVKGGFNRVAQDFWTKEALS